MVWTREEVVQYVLEMEERTKRVQKKVVDLKKCYKDLKRLSTGRCNICKNVIEISTWRDVHESTAVPSEGQCLLPQSEITGDIPLDTCSDFDPVLDEDQCSETEKVSSWLNNDMTRNLLSPPPFPFQIEPESFDPIIGENLLAKKEHFFETILPDDPEDLDFHLEHLQQEENLDDKEDDDFLKIMMGPKTTKSSNVMN